VLKARVERALSYELTSAQAPQNLVAGPAPLSATLKGTVNYPFVGDVIDHLRVGRTAFYRYVLPDYIRERRSQA
jgi:hypothetical protein